MSPGGVDRVLLVHGAWHGAWVWDPMLELLRELGLEAEAIDLPGHGDSPGELTDLHGDADHVMARLEETGGQTVLVGHSYGGMVITEAGTHPSVGGLVYVTGLLPLEGETLSTAGLNGSGDRPASAIDPWLRVVDGGSMLALEGEGAAEALYGDCDPATRQWALGRLGLQPKVTFQQPAHRLAWKTRDTTYIVCTLDRVIPVGRQRRMARHADRVLEIDAGHVPSLSAPERLAGLVADAVRGT